ncbi:hypothetical protein ABTG52_09055, partial [Acinetobacter baumannii]
IIGPLSHDMEAIQKQVSEDQKLLREKVLHLGGDAGIERMENALSDTRVKFFKERENGSPLTPLPALLLSQSSDSPSSSGISDEASKLSVGAKKPSSVVRSLFKDDLSPKEVISSVSGNRISQSSGESFEMQNVMMVNEYVHGEHLAFAVSSGSAREYGNGMMAKIKETMENAFWDRVVQSVKQDEPNYSHVMEL